MFPLQTDDKASNYASNYISALFCFIANVLGDFTVLILKAVSNLGIFLENINMETNY